MADDFEALPRSLQLQIDAAFDTAITLRISTQPSPKKRRKLETNLESEPTGGFIIEDNGGLTPPDEEETQDRHQSGNDLIPFSLIPTALQILDLPPDDPEVLQVFRNAASGWISVAGAGDIDGKDDMEGEGGAVSRKDWRAICAVVVGTREDIRVKVEVAGGFMIEDEGTTGSAEDSAREEEDDSDGDGEEGDAYEDSMSSEEEQDADSDSDEYFMGPSTSKSNSKVNGRNSQRTYRSLGPDGPSPRQKRAALEAFALFFPSSPPFSDADLHNKRLMFKDIVMVAELLKERIKAEEIIEMLSLFSTVPDKSISFDDFTRMMVIAKLAWLVSTSGSSYLCDE